MTIDEQIVQLNEEVRCTIQSSKMHGVGVFALRDIKKGERLHCQRFTEIPAVPFLNWLFIPHNRFNEIRSEIRSLIEERWPRVMFDRPFLSPNDDVRLLSFMNHADIPNHDPFTDCASRDIQTGEEITEDYRILGDNAKVIYPWL